jgi:hypothetical protein
MRIQISRGVVALHLLGLLGCERSRKNDSMEPEGITSSPRPVGTHEPTLNREGNEPQRGANDARVHSNAAEASSASNAGVGQSPNSNTGNSGGAGGSRNRID